MNPIIVRKAKIRDKSALLHVEEKCFITDRINARQMTYLLTKAKAITWVAVAADQVAGYGQCLIPEQPRPARLYSLAVLPEYRRQGIAHQLMGTLLSELISLNYSRCRLEVRCSDHGAQTFYRSMGFSMISTLPAYYEDGENALRMECILRQTATFDV